MNRHVVVRQIDRADPAVVDALGAVGTATVFGFDFLLRNLRAYFVDSAARIADLKLASRIFEQVMGLRMAARPPGR